MFKNTDIAIDLQELRLLIYKYYETNIMNNYI